MLNLFALYSACTRLIYIDNIYFVRRILPQKMAADRLLYDFGIFEYVALKLLTLFVSSFSILLQFSPILGLSLHPAQNFCHTHSPPLYIYTK